MISKIVNILGVAAIVVLVYTSISIAIENTGGLASFVNKTMEDEEFRNNAIMYELSVNFVSPVYTVNVAGKNVDVVMDGLSLLALIAISMLIVRAVSMLFGSAGFPVLLLLFLLSFTLAGIAWQGFWMHNAISAGERIGLTMDKIEYDIHNPSLAENAWLFYIVIFSVGFILWKGHGAFL
jgi:amino acid transporter